METIITDSLERLAQTLAGRGFNKILLVADENTFAAANIGGELKTLLGKQLNNTFIFPSKRLTPDENAVAALTTAAEGHDFIAGIGSGVINDLCRYVAFQSRIEYAITATAASMDGYLSNVSPLIVNGKKSTLVCRPASYVAFLPRVLTTAPKIMTAAGAGDVFGKTTSVLDWDLARLLFNERFDAKIAAQSRAAADLCLKDENIPEIAANTENGIKTVIDALVLTGRAMNDFGGSRPASGSEHQLAHFWEDDFIKRNEDPPLHGVCVGAATVIAVSMLDELLNFAPNFSGENGNLYKQNWDKILTIIKTHKPDLDELKTKTAAVGCPTSYKELGVTDALFRQSLKEAAITRPRYTTLRLCDDVGLTDQLIKKWF